RKMRGICAAQLAQEIVSDSIKKASGRQMFSFLYALRQREVAFSSAMRMKGMSRFGHETGHVRAQTESNGAVFVRGMENART
ncbi:hypothetical protein ABTJ80_21005, partial [Acinetobacter baumannii]